MEFTPAGPQAASFRLALSTPPAHRVLPLDAGGGRPRNDGAELGNGVYFELGLDDARLVGTPMGIDLNLIAAPPRDLGSLPF